MGGRRGYARLTLAKDELQASRVTPRRLAQSRKNESGGSPFVKETCGRDREQGLADSC